MFSIIISEKGGAERTEGFDKSEINVGRVQGNDLVLPKGNVSKHHARLLFRDGRFIVTDLKSTNGTYVNGRKIAQATIVREGDKIYVGDYVLRLESAAEESAEPPGAEIAQEPLDAREQARLPGIPPIVTMKAPSVPPGAPLPRPQPSNVVSAPPPPLPPQMGLAAGTSSSPADETSGLAKARVPSQIAIGGIRSGTLPLNQASLQPPRAGVPAVPAPPPPPSQRVAERSRPPEVQVPAPSAPVPAKSAPIVPPEPSSSPSTRAASVPPPAAAYRTLPPRSLSKDEPGQAARRLAMTMLMGRIADAVDLSVLNGSVSVPEELAKKIETVSKEQASAMREEEEAPADVDVDALARDAHRELVGIGPLAALLEDDEVSEIHVARFDRVDVVRGDAPVTTESVAFTSEEALKRAIARLASQHGAPWREEETVFERRLPRASLVVVAPPVAPHHVLSIRKRAYLGVTLDALASSGTLSKPMAQFLEACAAARLNVVVCGNSEIASSLVLTALSALSTADERVCVAQDTFDVPVGEAQAIPLGLDTASIRAASKLRPNRLVVSHLTASNASATVDALVDGVSGILCGLVAPTLRQGLSRVATQLVLHRPGLALDSAREIVADAFDIAVEVSATSDGRTRVLRISELGGEGAKGLGLRDLFTFSEAGDGTFSSTGTVPRFAGDLAVRGIKLDPNLFKRGR